MLFVLLHLHNFCVAPSDGAKAPLIRRKLCMLNYNANTTWGKMQFSYWKIYCQNRSGCNTMATIRRNKFSRLSFSCKKDISILCKKDTFSYSWEISVSTKNDLLFKLIPIILVAGYATNVTRRKLLLLVRVVFQQKGIDFSLFYKKFLS